MSDLSQKEKKIKRIIDESLVDTYRTLSPSLCSEIERYFLFSIKESTNNVYTTDEIKKRFSGDFERYIIYISRRILDEFKDFKKNSIKRIKDETIKLNDIGIFDYFQDEINAICVEMRRYMVDSRNWTKIIDNLMIKISGKYFKSTSNRSDHLYISTKE